MGLRQPVDHDRIVERPGRGPQRDVPLLEGDQGIDFVANEPDLALAADRRQFGQLLAPDDVAAGVAWRVDQHDAGIGRDRGPHRRELERKVVGAVQWHGPHAQAERPGNPPVADVHGLRHQDLVAGIHQAGQDGVDGIGRPRKDDDLVGIAGMVRRLGFESRDGRAQRRLALGGRVMRAVVLHRRQGLVEDGFRRREIGVADAQQDDVPPGRLQRHPLVVDGPAAAVAAGQPLRDAADLHGWRRPALKRPGPAARSRPGRSGRRR